jgi:hypothetical protein
MGIWTRLFRGRGKSSSGVATYPNFPALGSSHAATGPAADAGVEGRDIE